ncbi:ring-cleaving dioxygenase [Falsiroseomonas sp.]|uniref:ring-cleaving dioxygenase n=1 Tax=Falsiroseomonas sp. TaxID=2870721 RepID=UPI002734E772|nr:ring-cleaving dioxygenase [Falsiroseomonas sp.]
MQLHGIHHLTAVSADAPGNHDFYTRILGMRLVKKTVNQDDVSAYHLFYADGVASPGTDLTFFDWPVGPERRGTQAITGTALRVAGAGAFAYWAKRFTEHDVKHGPVQLVAGRQQMAFEDPEGQRLTLLDDGGTGHFHPWDRSPVPSAQQIRGLGPITISVPELTPTARFLTQVMAMRAAGEHAAPDDPRSRIHVFEMGEGGPAAELHVRVEPHLPQARPGAGGVHHVAFRVRDDEYEGWVDRLQRLRIPSSGPVDRFYFRSLYTREPNGILYEIATDGPGFATDEPMESLGESLALPPFLEPRRAEIERGLKPLSTR